jgi:cytochrome c oxidase cbb3-type subunit 3
MKNLFKYVPPLALLSFSGLAAMAQSTPAQAAPVITPNQLVFLLIVVALIVAVACLMMATTLLYLVRQKKAETAVAAEGATSEVARVSEGIFSWKKINQVLTRSVPVAQEADIDLGHDFDGIRELDNRLPPWWLWGFYFTIVFSVVYMYYFHIGSDWSQDKQWAEEVETANAQVAEFMKTKAEKVDETNVVMADATGIAAGKEIYTTNCVACHGANGEGGVGPNLTDEYWLHGGSLSDVFKLVKVGVPEKGMISWSSTLRPAEIQNVSSFILTLQGTNPANGKAPQGEKYTPEAAPAAPADTTAATDGKVALK